LVYDLSFLLYASAPMALYLLLCPAACGNSAGISVCWGAVGVSLFVILFTACRGWLFWDELVRFNFIAVDLSGVLEEVINILRSDLPALALLAMLAVAFCAMRKAVLAALDAPRLRPAPALLSILGVLLLAGVEQR
jgi:hypothetical protein